MALYLSILETKLVRVLFQTISPQFLLFCFPITFITFCIHRIYFSPLSSLPGPTITALTSSYLTLLTHFNRRTLTLHEWHKHYGPVVRISPIEVSFISPQAVKEIYSNPVYGKYTRLYGIFQHFGEQNSFSSGLTAEHGWRRKAVSDRYTMSHVLKEEERSGKILRVAREYIGFIQASLPKITNSPTGYTGEHYRVDLYTANNFFASDGITSHLFGPKFSTRCLAGNEGDREMINEHYRSARKSTVHLKTEFPKLMEFVGKVVLLCHFLNRVTKTYLFRTLGPAETYTGNSRIENYGWHAYQKAKADGSCDGCVAEKLATLVKNNPNDPNGNRQTWSDKKAASELMVR